MKLLLVFFVLLTASLRAAPPPSAAEQARILDQIGQRLQGDRLASWQEIREAHGTTLSEATNEADFYRRLNGLLGKLELSHFHIAPPSSLDISPGGDGQLGMVVQLVGGAAVVTHIEPDSPASEAGVQAGWRLIAINGHPIAPFLGKLEAFPGTDTQKRASFAQTMLQVLSVPTGQPTNLTFQDQQSAEHRVELTGSQPDGIPMQFGNLPTLYGEVTQRRLDHNFGYVHFNVFMLPMLQQIQDAVQAMADTDGLILDLRRNPGGIGLMACPVAGLFVSEQVSLGRSNMEGGFLNFAVFPNPKPYTKPLVILVDETTGSTSEILTGGLQELSRATVIGRQTMGAVLPSVVVELPDGAKLQYAVADYHTPKGVQLEGRGVTPDIAVELSRENLANEDDPILQRAIDYLTHHQRNPNE